MLIFLAKLGVKDNPVEIADWAKNNAGELAQILGLQRNWMPYHNTYWRVFQEIISLDEFERLMEEYHRQEIEASGEVLAMDGKALCGTRKDGEERVDYVPGLYDGRTQQVKAQEVVEVKKNEIVAAPKILERTKLAGKIITRDAMHTQKSISEQIRKADGHY